MVWFSWWVECFTNALSQRTQANEIKNKFNPTFLLNELSLRFYSNSAFNNCHADTKSNNELAHNGLFPHRVRQSAALISLFLCAIDVHQCLKVIKITSTRCTVPPNGVICHISYRRLEEAGVSCAFTSSLHEICSLLKRERFDTTNRFSTERRGMKKRAALRSSAGLRHVTRE